MNLEFRGRSRLPFPLYITFCRTDHNDPNAMLCLNSVMLLVHINALLPQLFFCLFDLLHQLLVCLGNVIEAVHVVPELEEEVCAK